MILDRWGDEIHPRVVRRVIGFKASGFDHVEGESETIIFSPPGYFAYPEARNLGNGTHEEEEL